MKLLSILLVFVFGSASECRQQGDVVQIEVSKVSRGYQEHVRIDHDSLVVSVENRIAGNDPVRHARKIEPTEWKSLLASFSAIKLSDIPKLTSPGMKRAHDAAMHATISIITADGKKFDHGYDDEEPHDALKPLLRAVREMQGPVGRR